MKEEKERFGKILYALRKERKMSQQDVALAIRSSQQCVSQWENGVIEPTLTFLWRLADLFEVSIDELIGRKDY